MLVSNERVREKWNAQKRAAKALNVLLQRDICDVEVSEEIQFELPDPGDLRELTVRIQAADHSFWRGEPFEFRVAVPLDYPYRPPKVTCASGPPHPNIAEGVVCLGLVREDWLPVYSLSHVFQGLLSLMYAPNTEDPLNAPAAAEFSRWAAAPAHPSPQLGPFARQ